MKIWNVMKVSVLSLAVQSALMITSVLPQTVFAAGDESEDYALKHPSNSVEFGALYTSQQSAKFGQYNGLNQEGFYGLGGFDVRGGDGYEGKDSALRWWLNGSNLGTTSRTLGGKISEQGKWSLSIGWDELRHNITDTFQTPLQGTPGGNQFNLPADFGTVNGTSSGARTAGTRGLNARQLSAFQTEQEYTRRNNVPLSATYILSPQFSAQLDFNHLEQTGAKLIGTGSQGGITLNGRPSTTGLREAINFIMNPTSYTTDNINAALNWRGDNAHLTAGYYGSLFHDNYNSVSWQNAIASAPSGCSGSGCYVNNTMSTAPSNSLHQGNLSGGYDFSSATKLVGGLSYGYNMQDDNFAPTSILQPTGATKSMMQPGVVPPSSLNGLVETTHADLKLTNQSIKDLTLTAGFKFNQRDNQTSSNIYNYINIGTSGVGTNGYYTGVNTPYSNSKTQYEASAAYRLTKSQNLNLTYQREDINRWCNGVIGGAQCVSSSASNEDKVSLNYRLKAFDDIQFNAGYSYAMRNANFNKNFLSDIGNYPLTTAALSGGTASSVNGGNVLGYIAYPYANRNQNMGKAGINWQLTQQFDVGLNGRYTYDDYDARLGVQNGRSASVNVDANYVYAENSSISAYYSWQNGFRNLRSGANGTQLTAPTQVWDNQLDDTSNAFGLQTRNSNLLGGNLEIIGDISYALDRSSYATQTPYLLAATCAGASTLSCGSLPAIKNELFSVKFTGNYKIHKNAKLSLQYVYQQLDSNDYFYNGQQFGYTPTALMPTGLQPQSYSVNVVGLSYLYNF